MKDKQKRKHSTRMISCDQERKLGDRRRSDTVVVSTVNNANQGLKEEKKNFKNIYIYIFSYNIYIYYF